MISKKLIAEWNDIDTPLEVLKIVYHNVHYFGYDPYYADDRQALIEMMKRVIEKSENGNKSNI